MVHPVREAGLTAAVTCAQQPEVHGSSCLTRGAPERWLQVLFWCGVSAIPVVWATSHKDSKTKQPDIYMLHKQKAREERMRWIESDDMPTH